MEPLRQPGPWWGWRSSDQHYQCLQGLGLGILFIGGQEIQPLTVIRTVAVIFDTGGQLCERH